MKTSRRFWSYLAQFFLEWNVSDRSCRENQKTHFVLSNFFSSKIVPSWDNMEKYCRAGEATDDNMAHAHVRKATDTHTHIM